VNLFSFLSRITITNVELPHKKPRGGQLSDGQKAENRALASERVVCEHAFAGLKRYGIAHQVYRNRVEGFDDRSMVTAGWTMELLSGGGIGGKTYNPPALDHYDIACLLFHNSSIGEQKRLEQTP
jgi:hypothetical protein